MRKHDKRRMRSAGQPTLERLTSEAWRVRDPAQLTDKQVEDIEAVARSDIEVLNASHLFQECKEIFPPGHIRGHTLLYMPVRGAIRLRSGEDEWTVTPKHLVLIAAGQPHGAVSLKKAFEVITVHLYVSMPPTPPNQKLFAETVFPLPDAKGFHRQGNAVVSLFHRPGGADLGAHKVRHLLSDLVMQGAALLQHQIADPRIRKALQLLREPRLRESMASIAREVGMGSTRFRLLFRKHTGISPKAYHHEVRLKEVVRMLRETDFFFNDMASNVFYSNPQYLQRDFRLAFGISPGHFRKRRRGSAPSA